MNQAGQLQCSVKKVVTPNVSVLMATCYDINKKESFAAVPGFGFKVAFNG